MISFAGFLTEEIFMILLLVIMSYLCVSNCTSFSCLDKNFILLLFLQFTAVVLESVMYLSYSGKINIPIIAVIIINLVLYSIFQGIVVIIRIYQFLLSNKSKDYLYFLYYLSMSVFITSIIATIIVTILAYMHYGPDFSSILTHQKKCLYVFTLIMCISNIIELIFRKAFYTKTVYMNFIFINLFLFVSSTFEQFVFQRNTILEYIYIIITLCFLIMYHSDSYNTTTGTKSKESLRKLLDGNKFQDSNTTIITIQAYNINSLKARYDTEVASSFIADIFLYLQKKFNNATLYNISTDVFVVVTKEKITEQTNSLIRLINKMNNEWIINDSTLKLLYKINIIKSKDITSYDEYRNISFYINSQIELDSVKFYDDVMKENYHHNKDLKEILNNIVERKCGYGNENIKTFIQPIYDIKNKSFSSGESLMRLQLTDGTILFPDTFIPLLEQNKIIHQFTMMMLENVCKFISDSISNGYDIKSISVNFSVQDFENDNIVEEILNIVEIYHTPPEKIRIELTESISSCDIASLIEKMNKLIDIGILFYLDDFGTGYYNFNRIFQLPLYIIKFDKSLIDGAIIDNEKRKLLNNLTELIKQQGLISLYEGIEDDRYEKISSENKIQYLQGYLYSKPIPSDQALTFFKKQED